VFIRVDSWLLKLVEWRRGSDSSFKLLTTQRNTLSPVSRLRRWTRSIFLLTFVIVPMAHDFGIAALGYAITLTLAMRPISMFI
jgi:hypothetical protein